MCQLFIKHKLMLIVGIYFIIPFFFISKGKKKNHSKEHLIKIFIVKYLIN